jgi:hypothetical protein
VVSPACRAVRGGESQFDKPSGSTDRCIIFLLRGCHAVVGFTKMDLLSIVAMFKTERISPLISRLYNPNPTEGNSSHGIPSLYIAVTVALMFVVGAGLLMRDLSRWLARRGSRKEISEWPRNSHGFRNAA